MNEIIEINIIKWTVYNGERMHFHASVYYVASNQTHPSYPEPDDGIKRVIESHIIWDSERVKVQRVYIPTYPYTEGWIQALTGSDSSAHSSALIYHQCNAICINDTITPTLSYSIIHTYRYTNLYTCVYVYVCIIC